MALWRSRPGRRRYGAGRPERLTSEQGIALPAALMLLMIVVLLAAVAGTTTLSAMGQSGLDRNTKQAVAAIDAGMDTAIYRLNKLSGAAPEVLGLRATPSVRLNRLDRQPGCPHDLA